MTKILHRDPDECRKKLQTGLNLTDAWLAASGDLKFRS
jgi:hypothetical protein